MALVCINGLMETSMKESGTCALSMDKVQTHFAQGTSTQANIIRASVTEKASTPGPPAKPTTVNS